MKVVGGTYYETCTFPNHEAIFGSGGRAAAALANFGEIEFHTFSTPEHEETFRVALAGFGFTTQFHHSNFVFGFRYIHALSRPVYFWEESASRVASPPNIDIDGNVILRFGFMNGEGDATVNGGRVTYDPQSPEPRRFAENGSTAEHLAYVLNENELSQMYPGLDLDAAARSLLRDDGAEVVLIKRGVFGVRVITASGQTGSVPAYQTAKVFKIGSGDVFSAAFAYHWGERNIEPFVAARIASQSAAWYCDTKSLPLPEEDILSALMPVTPGSARQIYLAGPFFTVGQRLLIEETRSILMQLGAKVFSPFHDIGFGEPNVVAPADEAAIKGSALILALADDLDLGTNFEIGYGAAVGVKTIVQALHLPKHHYSMVLGSGGSVESDFATALYKAVWASLV